MSQPEMKVDSDGRKYWCLNNKYHREDGPAIEWPDGSKHWLLNGQYHREDGPAIENSDGTKRWFLNGEPHREDGPAVERFDGIKYWYLHGEEVTWQQLFRQANGDLEKECRILTYALT